MNVSSTLGMQATRQFDRNRLLALKGGAITHGHQIGATSAVLTTRLIHSMQRDQLKRGIATLCIGAAKALRSPSSWSRNYRPGPARREPGTYNHGRRSWRLRFRGNTGGHRV